MLELTRPAAVRGGTCRIPALSVIIITWNREKMNLPLCLASLNGLDCEVFVVDSGSTDLFFFLWFGARCLPTYISHPSSRNASCPVIERRRSTFLPSRCEPGATRSR